MNSSVNSSVKGFTVGRDVARKLIKEIAPTYQKKSSYHPLEYLKPVVGDSGFRRTYYGHQVRGQQRTFTRITNIDIIPLLLSGIWTGGPLVFLRTELSFLGCTPSWIFRQNECLYSTYSGLVNFALFSIQIAKTVSRNTQMSWKKGCNIFFALFGTDVNLSGLKKHAGDIEDCREVRKSKDYYYMCCFHSTQARGHPESMVHEVSIPYPGLKADQKGSR